MHPAFVAGCLLVPVGVAEEDGPPPVSLPTPALSEDVVHDYESLRLSLKAHPAQFLRERLAKAGAIPADRVNSDPAGRKTAVPFGPFLAVGGIFGFFFGDDLMDSYLDRF